MLQKINGKAEKYGKYFLSLYAFIFCLMVSTYAHAQTTPTSLADFIKVNLANLGKTISDNAVTAFLAIAAIGVAIFTYKAIKKVIAAA